MYKKTRVYFFFDMIHDSRNKARLVANVHLTDFPLSSVYSGVEFLREVRLVIFLSKLNGIDSCVTYVGNGRL